VQGAIGAGISFGLVYVLKVVLSNLVHPSKASGLLQGFYLTNADAVAIGAFVLFIGAGIGVLGSTIGLRRFLEV
jgi:cell division protein FtsX